MAVRYSVQRPSVGPSGWTALLEVFGPGGHRTSMPFKPPRVIVGRKRSSDLSLPDQGVSSSHCEFVIEGGWFVVRDLASINGTFVNDRRVSEARLRDGDVVRLGATKITVALQGSLGGVAFWSLETARRLWPWIVIALLVTTGAVGGVIYWRGAVASEIRLRAKYGQEVRGILQLDPCAAAANNISAFNDLDLRIAGRPVPLAAPGETLNASMRQTGVELLGLYRGKAEQASQGLQAVAEEQQKEHDAFERASRLAARLSSTQDRKVAYFTQQQLAERLQRGEALVAGLTAVTQETQRFAGLVEAVSLRNDRLRAPELATFRFAAKSPSDQLYACRADLARTNAGVIGAINGLAEE